MADIKLIIDVDDDGKIQKATDSLEKLEVAAKRTGGQTADMANSFSPSGNLQRNTFSLGDTVDETTNSLGMMFEQMAGGAAPTDAMIDFVAGLGGALGPLGVVAIPAVTAAMVILTDKVLEGNNAFESFEKRVERARESISTLNTAYSEFTESVSGAASLEVQAFQQSVLTRSVEEANKNAQDAIQQAFSKVFSAEEAKGRRAGGTEYLLGQSDFTQAQAVVASMSDIDLTNLESVLNAIEGITLATTELQDTFALKGKKLENLVELGKELVDLVPALEEAAEALDGVDESATITRDRSGLVRRRNGKTAKDPLKAWFEAQGIRSAPFITAPRYGGDFAANEFWASHDASSDDWKERRKEDLIQLGAEQLKAYFDSHGIRSAPFISAPRYGGNFAANEFWASHDASSDDWKERRKEDLIQLGAEQLKAYFDSHGIRSAPFISAPRYGGNFAANEFWASHDASSDDWKERRKEDLIQLGAEQLKAYFDSHGIRSAPFISAPRYGGNFAANEFWASHGASSDDWKERRREDLVQLGADQLKAFFESQGIRSAPFISAPRYGGNFAANEFWASHDASSNDYVTKGYAAHDVKMGVEEGLKAFFESHGIRSAPFISAPRYGGDFAANEFWASHDASSDDWKERRKEDLVQLGAEQLKAYFDSHGIRSAPFISAPRYGGNFAANEFWASHGASSDDYVTKGYAANDVKMGVEEGLKAYFESHGIRSAPFLSAPRYGGDFASNEFWASHGAPSDDYVTKGYAELDETLGDIYTLWADLKPMLEDRFYGDRTRPEMTPELEEKLYGVLENQWETVSDVLVRQGSFEEIYQAYASTQDTVLDAIIDLEESQDNIYTLWADLKPMMEDRFYGDKKRPEMTPELEEKLYGVLENQWETVSDVLVRQGSFEEIYQAYASTQDTVLDAIIDLEEAQDNIYTLWADLKPMMEDRFYGDRERPEMTPELEEKLYGLLENQWEMVSDVLVNQGSFEEIYQAYASTQDTILDELVEMGETNDDIYTLWADLKPMLEDRFYGDRERPLMTPELEDELYFLIENQWEMVSDVMMRQGTLEEIYQTYASTQDSILDALIELEETNDKATEVEKDLKVAQEANTEALNKNAELLRDFFKSQGVDIRPFSTAPRYGGEFGRNEFWAMHDYPEEEFAAGGVVNRATRFGMSNGRRGVMGEAGPEAILPLRRGADGKLGVAVNGEGGQVVIHQSFNFSANGDDSVKRIIASEAPKIAKITERSIINSRQRGGSIRKVFG